MGLEPTHLFGDQIAASRIGARFSSMDTRALLALAIEHLFADRIALVSSFGADSAVLLHMVAQIDRSTPVIFVDTRQLFPETLAYRDQLVDKLKLTNLIEASPDAAQLAAQDPEGFLWASDADKCCDIRKTQPLAKVLGGYEAWITGRKRFQASTRSALSFFEAEGDRVKLNPLANWEAAQILAYLAKHSLPSHALVAKNYLSIGCLPCTSPVRPGEDARAGRWRGKGKAECGIHLGTLNAGEGI